MALQPRRLYLITAPRTASNLLTKIIALDQQLDVHYLPPNGYFYMGANEILDPELNIRLSPVSSWGESTVERVRIANQSSFENLNSYLDEAEKAGKIAFVKEHVDWLSDPSALLPGSVEEQEDAWEAHVYKGDSARGHGNHTILPDAFLKTWQPTFLIRHPALVFPSHYRAMKDVGLMDPAKILDPVQMRRNKYRFSLYWARSLYSLYVSLTRDGKDDLSGETWPLVLEADDIMTKPEVLVKWCQLAGLDTSKLRYQWKPATDEEKAKFPAKYRAWVLRHLDCIHTSSSILTDKISSDINIDDEAVKWKEEFGEEAGAQIEEHVRGAMEDYQYLKARRLRA